MKIGILSSNRNEWHVKRIVDVLEKENIDYTVFSIKRFVTRISSKPKVVSEENILDEIDALIVREAPIASLERLIFRMDVLHRLESMGIKVVNPASSIEKTCDKYYCSFLLEESGIPTPKTVVTESFRKALEAFHELGGDVVVKPLFGAQGIGMVRVDNVDIAHKVFRALEISGSVFYLQRFIPHHNRDIRAFIIGNEVFSSMLRKSSTWKTNVSQGAEPEKCDLSRELEKISVKASKIVGCEYSGVDILESESGEFFVTEVNSIPAWKGLQKVTAASIAKGIVNHVLKLLDA